MSVWSKIAVPILAAALLTGCSAVVTSPEQPDVTPTGSQYTAVALDGEANLYAAGFVDGFAAADWGNGVASSGTNDQTSSVLVKFDADRKPVWVRTAASGASRFNAVAAGEAVYAAGVVEGSAVVIKYDADGTLLWTRKPTSTPGVRSQFNAVALDADGNVYAAGWYLAPVSQNPPSLDFGGVSLSGSSRAGNLLIVKYDPEGEALWARTQTDAADNPNLEFAYQSIAVAVDGVYAAGGIEARSTVDLGSGVTVRGNGTFYGNGVLVKYGTDGATLWARTQTSGSSSAWYYGVAVGSGIYVCGEVYDAAVGFGNGVSLPATGGKNVSIFVMVKYDSSGQTLWARHPGSNHGSSSLRAIVAGDGVYAAGWTASDTVDLGSGVAIAGLKVPSNPGNLLLVRYGDDGTAQEVRSVPDSAPKSAPTSFYHALILDSARPLAAGGAGSASLGGTLVNRAAGAPLGAILVRY